MPVNLRVKVIGLGTDSDPFTGAMYTAVTFAIESALPRPAQPQNQFPPVPRPVGHKHIMHVFVPTIQWNTQYGMWQEFDLTIEDSGELRLIPAQTTTR